MQSDFCLKPAEPLERATSEAPSSFHTAVTTIESKRIHEHSICNQHLALLLLFKSRLFSLSSSEVVGARRQTKSAALSAYKVWRKELWCSTEQRQRQHELPAVSLLHKAVTGQKRRENVCLKERRELQQVVGADQGGAEATGNINCCFICRWNAFCDLCTIDETKQIFESRERKKYNKS